MLRIFLWITAFVVALPLVLGLYFWFISQPSVTTKSFDLAGGKQVAVKQEVFSGYDGDTTSISLSLRYADGFVEEVAKVDYGESSPDFSYGPFELRQNEEKLVLRNNTEFYTRPPSWRTDGVGSWKREGDLSHLRELPEIRAFALNSMPDAYGKLTKYSLNYPIPNYFVERWDISKNVVVLLRPKQPAPNQTLWGFNWKDYKYQSWLFRRWPRRLIFRDFQFDKKSTLALEKASKK